MIYFTIGTDVEFPLINTKTGNFVSAIPIIKGKKHSPQYIENGSALQHDNVALEFAVPPSDTEDGFVQSIGDTIGLVKAKYLPKNIGFRAQASAIYRKVSLRHKDAREIGCDPDFSCWTGTKNEVDPTIMEKPLRSFGGHIHIGSIDWLKNPNYTQEIVKCMDLFLGVPSVLLDTNYYSIKRKELYGRAGSYRTPPHGVEYRTLSNFWLKDQDHVRLYYKLTRDCVNYFSQFNTEQFVQAITRYYGLHIDTIIDTCNVNNARTIVRELKFHELLLSDTIDMLELCVEKLRQEQPTIGQAWLKAA